MRRNLSIIPLAEVSRCLARTVKRLFDKLTYVGRRRSVYSPIVEGSMVAAALIEAVGRYFVEQVGLDKRLECS